MAGTKKKKRIAIVTMAVILGIVMMLLTLLDFNNTVIKSITGYQDSQDLLVEAMTGRAASEVQSNGSAFTEQMVLDIEESFPTSSSRYCILAKDDAVVFLKDENTTSTLSDEQISNFFNEKNISSRDNKKYIISRSEIQYEGSTYILVICTRQSYFVKNLNLNEARLHCLGYFLLYGAAMLVAIVFSFYQLGSEEKEIGSLKEELKKNRLLIEKLEKDKNRNYAFSEKEEQYSFLDRSIVDEIIASMSEEEKKKCVQIDITVEQLRMEHFVQITAILGRIKEGNSVACYWDENCFKILLLRAGKEEAQNFIDLFLSKYKSESREKVEELKIVATRLVSTPEHCNTKN